MASPFDPLIQFSDALADRVVAASPLVAALSIGNRSIGAGIVWRPDVIVASEQMFPKTETVSVQLAGDAEASARVAGRDPGTNVIALRLDRPVTADLPGTADPRLGALALALGRDGDATARLGIVSALGPAWHSQAGGRIDRRVTLDLALSRREEGGPVLDAAGGLLGMSTAGPRGRALVIPAATVERVLEPLLAQGRVARGWLGLAFHPVAVPEALRVSPEAARGLMVMAVSADGPAAKAGVLAGDIVVAFDGAAPSETRRLAERLGPDSIGRAIALRLVRAGAIVTVSVTPEARPAA